VDLPLPLEGLYLHLVRRGFPISVRDYQDALTALRRGYGTPRREDLRWLCETLWVRTEQEASRLDRLFREFPWPSAEHVREITGTPAETPKKPSRRGSTARRRPEDTREAAPHAPAALEFAAPSQSGVGLPRAVTPARPGEVFIFNPRPLVSLRSLIIAFRRFRIAQRSGPRVELDVNATVAEQCRRGTLLQPVLVPARRNQARLVVLVDGSPSMVTWRPMNRLIADALGNSLLAHTALLFFDNSPAEDLYEVESLGRAIDIRKAREQHAGSALVIVSDAGAARGHLVRERTREIRAFLAASRSGWHPIVWLNPMPRSRWAGTTAAQIAALVPMFQFTDEGLIKAVDYLRGKLVA
jgi:uncharacterized protein with von Willebrand factor type A (vWA) domain